MACTMSCVLLVVLGCMWTWEAAVPGQALQSEPLGDERQWQVWKLMHDKDYSDIDEDRHRRAIWQANLKVCANAS